jgi:hypothetical protein
MMRITLFSRTAPLIALAACSTQSGSAPAASLPPSSQDTLQQPVLSGPAGQEPALSGVVRELVDGKLVLERMDGSSVTVTLTKETSIRQQVEASATDIARGTQVTVLAEAHESPVSAALVQIGGEAAPLLMTPAGAGGPGGAPATIPLGPGAPAGPKPQVYSGAVQEVGDDTLTLRQDSAALLTVRLTGQTRYQQEVSVDIGALQIGALVIAEGERDGNLFWATTLRLLSAPEPPRRAE